MINSQSKSLGLKDSSLTKTEAKTQNSLNNTNDFDYRLKVCHVVDIYIYTVKLVYNDTFGATKMCCYNQVVVVTRTFSTETIESVPAMCVVVKRLML